MEGERRIVTMLFCHVTGSTAVAENLDPEEWAETMNGAFEWLMAPVDRYGGTLARLMGDAIFAIFPIFAFFGALIAHEDDPERAVAAGLQIIDGIAEYRERLTARGLDLNIRVGINTGPVMVGLVGSELRTEYTAMGDAVNVAARMEQTAEPGTVQITDGRWRRSDGTRRPSRTSRRPSASAAGGCCGRSSTTPVASPSPVATARAVPSSDRKPLGWSRRSRAPSTSQDCAPASSRGRTSHPWSLQAPERTPAAGAPPQRSDQPGRP